MTLQKTLHNKFPNRVLTPATVDDIPRDQYLVYILGCDGKAIVVGQGKYNRARVIFDCENTVTWGHKKSIFVRLRHLFTLKPSFERYLVTCYGEESAKADEKALQKEIGGNTSEVPPEVQSKLLEDIEEHSLPWLLLKFALRSANSGMQDLKNWRNDGLIKEEAWKTISDRLKWHKVPERKKSKKTKGK